MTNLAMRTICTSTSISWPSLCSAHSSPSTCLWGSSSTSSTSRRTREDLPLMHSWLRTKKSERPTQPQKCKMLTKKSKRENHFFTLCEIRNICNPIPSHSMMLLLILIKHPLLPLSLPLIIAAGTLPQWRRQAGKNQWKRFQDRTGGPRWNFVFSAKKSFWHLLLPGNHIRDYHQQKVWHDCDGLHWSQYGK